MKEIYGVFTNTGWCDLITYDLDEAIACRQRWIDDDIIAYIYIGYDNIKNELLNSDFDDGWLMQLYTMETPDEDLILTDRIKNDMINKLLNEIGKIYTSLYRTMYKDWYDDSINDEVDIKLQEILNCNDYILDKLMHGEWR